MSKIAVNEITNEAGTGGPTLPNGVAGGLTLGGDLTLDTNGIYLGGTGSANYLDDYEEGTFTPTVQTGTASYLYAHYTKVGRLVNCGAVITSFSDRSSSNTILFALPFTSRSGARFKGTVVVRFMTNTENTTVVEIGDSDSFGNILVGSSGNYAALKHSDLSGTSSQFQFEICYETDA